jgi:CDP-diacylglycerol---glycerol-3-phosphate 3-phosphatidyltransferase
MNKANETLLPLRLNVPNIFTALRLILTIVIVLLLIQDTPASVLIASILLVLACISDSFDGYLARKLDQMTLSGALFYIIVDILLMGTILILSIILGYWQRTSGLMPFNPYPFALLVLAADSIVLVAMVIFFIKLRTRNIVFPTPTPVARFAFSIQMSTLIVAITGIGPNLLLVALMYVSIAFTLAATYSYLKKGSYIFTK